MFKPKGPVCQSCSMPLSRDSLGGGTHKDGSLSAEYCSHCFRDGRFTEPDITMTQMISKVEGKLRSMHFPAFMARWFTKGIPSLRRWQVGPS